MIPNALGDITTPASGRGVQPADLRDLDARRRFGAFGRTFVELERLRQSQSAGKSRIKAGDNVGMNRSTFGDDSESLYERSCVTRQFVAMYNVISSRFLTNRTVVISHLVRTVMGPVVQETVSEASNIYAWHGIMEAVECMQVNDQEM